MPPERDAGAIIVQLKAQIDSLEKGFAKAKQTLKGFGEDAQQTSKTVTSSGTRMGSVFDDLDRRGGRFAARAAMMANRLLSLQLVMQTFGSRLQGGNFSRGVQVASDSLVAFGAVASVFPNQFGLLAGGAAAVAVAFGNMANSFSQAEEKAKKLREEFQKRFDTASRQQGRALLEDVIAGGLTGRLALQISDAQATLKRTLEEREVVVNNIAKAERESAEQARKDEERRLQLVKDRKTLEEVSRKNPLAGSAIGVQIATIDRTLRELDKSSEERSKNLAKLRGDLVPLEANVQTLTNALGGLDRRLEESKATDTYTKAMAELKSELSGIESKLKSGLITPVQASEETLENLNKQLQTMLDNLNLLKASGSVSGDVERQIKKKQLEIADAQFAFAFAQDDENTKQREIEKRLAAEELERLKADVNRQAENFGGAISQGLADGILSGASSLETLAGIGRNLFSNMVNDLAGKLQTELASVFKTIAGEAGAGIATALTAAIGVAAGIFSRRKSKSSQSYDSVRSQVDDSTPLRGIVAGPSNIAIATVSEDIARAVAPVVDGIKVLAKIMSKVEVNTRGGGPAGGGGLDPVFVPTSP